MDQPPGVDVIPTLTRRMRALLALSLVGSLALVGCGDDDDPAVSSDDQETEDEAASEPADGETIEVTAVEYEFQGLPTTLEVGTQLTMTNGGKEAHELVLINIPDAETRSVEELLELPEEEAQAATRFKGVAIAAPGEDGEVVEGELVVDEPGRYVAICFIPVGTTELSDGPPEEGEGGGGPPHFTQGMVAELTVE